MNADPRINIWSDFRRLVEEYDPHNWLWLVSYSGGKDSTLLLFIALELSTKFGFKIGVVYNDSGGDVPELRQLAREVLRKVSELGHEVYVTKPEMTFFDYLLTKYSPPRWNFRWCCKRLKEIPFRELALKLSKQHKVLNLIGNRREEARWRNWKVKAVSERLVYVAPLLRLSAKDVWRALFELASWSTFYAVVVAKLMYIYSGAERSGCWFCPLVTKDKLLSSRPELLKLKYQILRAWCSGNRNKIVELSRMYPDLVQVTVAVDETPAKYPCGRKCAKCQVSRTITYLEATLALS